MSAASSWKVMAVVGPTLSLSVGLAFTRPARAWLFQVATCQMHLPARTLPIVLLAMVVMTVAITLTFATAVLQSTRHGWFARTLWVIAILFASPLSVPLYWFLFLRDGGV